MSIFDLLPGGGAQAVEDDITALKKSQHRRAAMTDSTEEQVAKIKEILNRRFNHEWSNYDLRVISGELAQALQSTPASPDTVVDVYYVLRPDLKLMEHTRAGSIEKCQELALSRSSWPDWKRFEDEGYTVVAVHAALTKDTGE